MEYLSYGSHNILSFHSLLVPPSAPDKYYPTPLKLFFPLKPYINYYKKTLHCLHIIFHIHH